MRIISGFLKGKKLDFLKSSTTRPVRDFVKENIFNIAKIIDNYEQTQIDELNRELKYYSVKRNDSFYNKCSVIINYDS